MIIYHQQIMKWLTKPRERVSGKVHSLTHKSSLTRCHPEHVRDNNAIDVGKNGCC